MASRDDLNGNNNANQSWRDWAQMCLRELDNIEDKIKAIEDKVDGLSDTVNQIVKERMLEDHKHDLAIKELEIKVGLIGAGAGIFVPVAFEVMKILIAK